MEETNGFVPQELSLEKEAVENKITKALNSPLFMTVSLLFTVSFGIEAFLSFFLSGSLSLDIITLLIIIGLWMTYSAAKDTPLTESVPVSGMNLISGTVKAVRIICLVLSVLCMIAGIAFLVMIFIVNTFPEISEAYMGEVQAALYILIKQSFGMFDSVSKVTAFSFFMAVLSIGMSALFYVLGYRIFLKKAHRFVYSLCEHLKTGTSVENGNALFVWLMVLGIISAVFALLSGTSVLIDGTRAAALIVASCWIKTYFVTNQ